jgi:hypothetical protein
MLNNFQQYQMALWQYSGFLISGWSLPVDGTNGGFYSKETVCRQSRASSIVKVTRLTGPTFATREEADDYGLKLCRAWVDQQRP